MAIHLIVVEIFKSGSTDRLTDPHAGIAIHSKDPESALAFLLDLGVLS